MLDSLEKTNVIPRFSGKTGTKTGQDELHEARNLDSD